MFTTITLGRYQLMNLELMNEDTFPSIERIGRTPSGMRSDLHRQLNAAAGVTTYQRGVFVPMHVEVRALGLHPRIIDLRNSHTWARPLRVGDGVLDGHRI